MDKTLVEKLAGFFNSRDSVVLFAGAGVSARAGLPIWHGLLKNLAETCKPYGPYLSGAIVEAIEANRLVQAATMYMTSGMPIAEKYAAIEHELETYDTKALRCLASLPFKYVVTTNYDQALNDAFSKAHKNSSPDFFYPDPSLGRVPFEKKFFIARVHGRIFNPDSIVLDELGYHKLKSNVHYEEALREVFARQNALFIGFSFADPAIDDVLTRVSASVSTIQSGRHIALLPSDSPAAAVKEFANRNIEVVKYSPDNHHRELWEALCDLPNHLRPSERPSAPESPFRDAHKYLASCYARFKMGAHLSSLRDVVIQGIITSEIVGNGGVSSLNTLSGIISKTLAIPNDESIRLTKKAVLQLNTAGQAELGEDEVVRWLGSTDQSHAQRLAQLTNSVVHRARVRENVQLVKEATDHIPQLIEDVVVQRGWDLGAAFASNRFPDQIKVGSIVSRRRLPSGFPLQVVVRSLESLLLNPEPREALVLAELGRVAFALELVIRSPRDAELHSLTLPERVYLDANVLMPAIVEGHPYKRIYEASINALIGAADKARVSVKVLANRVALEEIISHRYNGIKEMAGEVEIDKKALRNEALFYGSENINVYKAGYAGVLSKDNELEFPAYIDKFASYTSQQELERYLSAKGIEIATRPLSRDFEKLNSDILLELQKGYNKEPEVRKHPRLIPHDALQLAQLATDIELGRRALFVTADRTLRDVIDGSRYSSLANFMISHVGLTNMIDLVVGPGAETPGAAKLIWGTAVTGQAEQIRNYLVNLALNKYDAAMMTKMGRIVDDVAEDFVFAAEKEGLSLDSHRREDKEKIDTLLEQYEDRFFEKMHFVMDQQNRKE